VSAEAAISPVAAVAGAVPVAEVAAAAVAAAVVVAADDGVRLCALFTARPHPMDDAVQLRQAQPDADRRTRLSSAAAGVLLKTAMASRATGKGKRRTITHTQRRAASLKAAS
jgi:hypothetical protein